MVVVTGTVVVVVDVVGMVVVAVVVVVVVDVVVVDVVAGIGVVVVDVVGVVVADGPLGAAHDAISVTEAETAMTTRTNCIGRMASPSRAHAAPPSAPAAENLPAAARTPADSGHAGAAILSQTDVRSLHPGLSSSPDAEAELVGRSTCHRIVR